jgi:putative methionine-R-sulfoxide reductase with GAF domain
MTNHMSGNGRPETQASDEGLGEANVSEDDVSEIVETPLAPESPELVALKKRLAAAEDAYWETQVSRGLSKLMKDLECDFAAGRENVSSAEDDEGEIEPQSETEEEDSSRPYDVVRTTGGAAVAAATEIGTRSEQTATPLCERRPPAVGAVHRFMRFWRGPLVTYVNGELSGELGILAERHRARWSGLFVPRGDKLVEISANGYASAWVGELNLEDTGIVTLVARTRETYCAPEVEGDPYYNPVNRATRSEQAVPIMFQGRLLGVLNQESHIPGRFCPATAKALEQETIRLVPHLLARAAHMGETPDGTAYLWNPDRHGWDMSLFLHRVITDIRTSLGEPGYAMHLTIWYADPVDRVLFALASTGYGGAFLRTRVIEMDESFTGSVAKRPEGTVDECLAGDPRMMVRRDIDQAMGLTQVRAVTIRSCVGSDGNPQPGMVLSVYAFDPAAEPAVPTAPQLQEIAALLRPQVDGYRTLRPALATAFMMQLLSDCPDSEDAFTRAAEIIARVLEGDAVTVFARPRAPIAVSEGQSVPLHEFRDSKQLHVVAATAPLEFSLRLGQGNLAPPPRERSLNGSGYTVNDGSPTGTLAAHPGSPLRLNSPKSRGILSKSTPSYVSFKIREWLPKAVSAFRRCLAYGVAGRSGDRALGVLRVIRSSEGRPFTICDGDVLGAMAQACDDEFRSWRDWFDYAVQDQSCASTRRRLVQPIPRSANRSARTLAREVLVDVLDLVRDQIGDYALHAVVLIEQPGDPDEPMGVFAYHSNLLNHSAVDGYTPALPPRFSPLALRIPGINWDTFLDHPGPTTFAMAHDDEETPVTTVCAGARIPFWAWCGRHVQRGALVVDLSEPQDLRAVIDDLNLAAQKLAAILTLAGSTAARSRITSAVEPSAFLGQVRHHLKASAVCLAIDSRRSTPRIWVDGAPLPPEVLAGLAGGYTRDSSWTPPEVVIDRSRRSRIDPDALRWGVRERRFGSLQALSVPLRLGTNPVGSLLATWETAGVPDCVLDPTTLRSLRIRDILALWSLWNWSRRENGLVGYKLRVVDGPEGFSHWRPEVTSFCTDESPRSRRIADVI